MYGETEMHNMFFSLVFTVTYHHNANANSHTGNYDHIVTEVCKEFFIASLKRRKYHALILAKKNQKWMNLKWGKINYM